MHKKLMIIFMLLLAWGAGLAGTQAETQEKSKDKFSYFGKPTPRTLLLGMWTTHLWTNQFGTLQTNSLIGFIDRGIFVGTFTNSYSHRSYTAGLNRYWLSKNLSKNTELELGYRLGLIYGYKKGEVLFSSSSPIIPFVQLVSDLNWKRVGIEISTTGQVVSGGFYFRF